MQTHHVVYKGFTIKLAAISEELFKQFVLVDHVIFKLDPGCEQHKAAWQAGKASVSCLHAYRLLATATAQCGHIILVDASSC
jgi:hypothetical protein